MSAQLVGCLWEGAITGCYCESGTVAGCIAVGGLVGDNIHGQIDRCHATCDVTGSLSAGGLVGSNGGIVSHCAAGGRVSGGTRVGGLAGINELGTVRGSHALADVNGFETVGGLVGAARCSVVVDCFSSGPVQGSLDVGGLAGINEDSTISDCYAAGSVTWIRPSTDVLWRLYKSTKLPEDIAIAGLVGRSRSDNETFEETEIVRCYCVGPVSGYVPAAGLVGVQQGEAVTVASFWDIQATGQALSAGGEGKSTAKMQDPNTFTAAGWDFLGHSDGPHDVWAMPTNGGYPILASQLLESTGLPEFSGGNGKPDDPHLISTADQLNSIGHNPRLMDSHFLLLNDIDMTGVAFFCIGCKAFPFAGVFDGDGHTVSNLGRVAGQPANVGLFGYASGDGTIIRNLGLTDPNINCPSAAAVGSLVGWLDQATVRDCFVVGGHVAGKDYVGGLVGYIYYGGSVVRCWSDTDVLGEGVVGGLVGYIDWGTVANSCSRSAVAGEWAVGGLVGRSGSEIVDCYAEGSVQGQGDIGGLIGLSRDGGRITNSYSSAKVTGLRDTGGLVGLMFDGKYLQSFWDRQISGQSMNPGGYGKTTAEMQTAATFVNAGWDFVDTWMICEGRDYPRLRWEGIVCGQ